MSSALARTLAMAFSIRERAVSIKSKVSLTVVLVSSEDAPFADWPVAEVRFAVGAELSLMPLMRACFSLPCFSVMTIMAFSLDIPFVLRNPRSSYPPVRLMNSIAASAPKSILIKSSSSAMSPLRSSPVEEKAFFALAAARKALVTPAEAPSSISSAFISAMLISAASPLAIFKSSVCWRLVLYFCARESCTSSSAFDKPMDLSWLI